MKHRLDLYTDRLRYEIPGLFQPKKENEGYELFCELASRLQVLHKAERESLFLEDYHWIARVVQQGVDADPYEWRTAFHVVSAHQVRRMLGALVGNSNQDENYWTRQFLEDLLNKFLNTPLVPKE